MDKLTIMILFYSEKEIRRIKNLNLREDYLAKVLYSDKNRIMIIIIMDLFLEVVVIIILIKVTKIKEGYLVDKHHLYLEVIITIIKNKKLQIYLEDLHFSLIILMVKITKAIILEDYFLDWFREVYFKILKIKNMKINGEKYMLYWNISLEKL